MDVAISIIVPIFNAELSLKECIESILKQTFSNFELILVNDGSTDCSLKICEDYKKFDSRIRVFNQKNQGVSAARNKGIEVSKGKYLFFVDSDDTVEQTWIEELYNENLKMYNGYTLCGILCKKNRCNNYTLVEKIFPTNQMYIKMKKEEFFKLYQLNLLNSVSNKIYNKAIIEDYQICFKNDLSLGEDLLFNLDYLTYVNNDITIVNKCLYNYRLTEKESLDNRYYENLYQIYIRIYNELYYSFIKFNSSFDNYKKDFYQSYYEMLIKVLRNTYHKNSQKNFVEKLKYNKEIMKSDEFNQSIKYANLINSNLIFNWIINKKNSYAFFLYLKFKNLLK